MIGYLNGTVATVADNYIILEVNGVGYRIVLPEKMHSSIAKTGENIKVFTHYMMNTRDGSVTLYGFETPEELRFFELLTTVSGIGPKSAQGILSKADLQSLQLGIMKEDDKYLSKVASIGPKTAQRLIIELKNKVVAVGLASGDINLTTDSEAMDALVTLGYSQYQARDALKNISDKVGTTEEKITESLKILAKK